MIVLDTHAWIWWVQDDPAMPGAMRRYLVAHEHGGFGVSAISVLEVARAVSLGGLTIPLPVEQWVDEALNYPNVQLVELSPPISILSTRLPGTFHRDPQDRIIVATAIVLGCPLVTVDWRIKQYPHVTVVP